MPPFQGLVTEEQLNALVAYVKSLNPPATGAAATAAGQAPGAQPAEQKVQP
jgi:mono/diheme cytochrome c family protein